MIVVLEFCMLSNYCRFVNLGIRIRSHSGLKDECEMDFSSFPVQLYEVFG